MALSVKYFHYYYYKDNSSVCFLKQIEKDERNPGYGSEKKADVLVDRQSKYASKSIDEKINSLSEFQTAMTGTLEWTTGSSVIDSSHGHVTSAWKYGALIL